jgi:hypothetical protein
MWNFHFAIAGGKPTSGSCLWASTLCAHCPDPISGSLSVHLSAAWSRAHVLIQHCWSLTSSVRRAVCAGDFVFPPACTVFWPLSPIRLALISFWSHVPTPARAPRRPNSIHSADLEFTRVGGSLSPDRFCLSSGSLPLGS